MYLYGEGAISEEALDFEAHNNLHLRIAMELRHSNWRTFVTH